MKSRKKGKTEPKTEPKEQLVPYAERGGMVGISNPGALPVRVSFHEVKTSELVEIADLNAAYPEVKDRFVKVCPRLRASKRQTFDGATVAAELRELGARSVVLAPIIAPDAVKVKSKVSLSQTPREAVKTWCDEQRITAEERAAMADLIFGFMTEEGL
jgi:hypothetical protein